MRKILLLTAIFIACTCLSAQTGTGPKKQSDPVQISTGPKNDPKEVVTVDKIAQKTTAISNKIKLEEDKYKALYNVISQTEKRIEDLSMETEDYTKMLGYIHQERKEMLKAVMSVDQYKSYEKFFASKDAAEMNKLAAKSRGIVTKKRLTDDRNKKQGDALMKKERDKQKMLDQKEKDKAKATLDKQKALEKREADKAKALAKKEADKAKALAKKEKDKQKALDKKAKDKAKAEAAKQKALDKKEAARAKRAK